MVYRMSIMACQMTNSKFVTVFVYHLLWDHSKSTFAPFWPILTPSLPLFALGKMSIFIVVVRFGQTPLPPPLDELTF